MGVIDTPVVPMAWREVQATAVCAKQVGLELIGRTTSDGKPVVFWGVDSASCIKKATEAGYKI